MYLLPAAGYLLLTYCFLTAIICVNVLHFCPPQIPASAPLLQLVAVDWFHSDERIDNVAARPGSLMQVGMESKHYILHSRVNITYYIVE